MLTVSREHTKQMLGGQYPLNIENTLYGIGRFLHINKLPLEERMAEEKITCFILRKIDN